MSKVILRKNNKDLRKVRVRKKVIGTSSRPRMSVFRSNKFIYAQLIDDIKRATLVSTFRDTQELHKGKSKLEAALDVGKDIAKKAKEKKIKTVVFDRNGYKYHGRVKNVAEGAREGGLKL